MASDCGDPEPTAAGAASGSAAGATPWTTPTKTKDGITVGLWKMGIGMANMTGCSGGLFSRNCDEGIEWGDKKGVKARCGTATINAPAPDHSDFKQEACLPVDDCIAGGGKIPKTSEDYYVASGCGNGATSLLASAAAALALVYTIKL